MKAKLLEVINLQTHFSSDEGTVRAVDSVSFTLYRGESLGIVGESGSGKSVTALSIMRLIAEPAGKIVGGQILYYPKGQTDPVDLLRLSADEMRAYRGKEIAMIFQEPMTSLNPVFTCGAQVVEAIQLHQKISKKAAKTQTIALFEQVKLPDAERVYAAYPHQLSGGQKQRVMIAMAMSCQPSLLIADEPTTALDVTVQKTILDLMLELELKNDESILFITHDLGVVAEIADRVLVMYKGRVVEYGSVEQIFLHPQHPYTKGLLACRPPLEYRLKRLPVVADFMTATRTDDWYDIEEKKVSIGEIKQDMIVTTEEQNDRLTDLYIISQAAPKMNWIIN